MVDIRTTATSTTAFSDNGSSKRSTSSTATTRTIHFDANYPWSKASWLCPKASRRKGLNIDRANKRAVFFNATA
jgi:hypothetical protein